MIDRVGGRGNGELSFMGAVSVQDDEKILEMDSGGDFMYRIPRNHTIKRLKW